MSDLPPTTAEQRASFGLSLAMQSLEVPHAVQQFIFRLLADIERLEAVAEAAERYMGALEEMDAASTVTSMARADELEMSARAALRQALAEAGKG